MDNLILTSQNNGVLTVTLNRANKKNALTQQMYAELTQHLNSAHSSKDVRCVLIQGNKQCFCAGNDLNDFLASSPNNPNELSAFNFIDALATFNKPIVVAVAGPCVGIGSTLLLHADYIVAEQNSVFAMPFAKLGLCPEAGSSAILTERIGHNKAFELFVLGENFNAETALTLNIINTICHADDLLPKALDYAEKIARLPSDAVQTTRALIKRTHKEQLMTAIKHEKAQFLRLLETDDCQNIIKQFFK